MADVEYLISLRDKMSGPLKSIEAQMKSLDSTIQKGGHSVNKIEKNSNGAAIAMQGLATALAGVGFVRFAGNALKASTDLEKTRVSFETMLGSAEKGNKLLGEITEFGTKTPFTLKEVEQNSKLLMGMGIEAENLISTMKSLGDVSAGLDVPLSRLALNYGQVKARGKMTGAELRDFAVAGVPMLDMIAKQLGVGKSAVTELVSKGGVNFEMVQKAFGEMTKEGGRFANLMEKINGTLGGQINQMQESFEILMRSVGNAIGDFIKPFINVINKVLPYLLKNGKAIENIASVAIPFASAAIITLGYASLKASGLLSGMGGALKSASIAAIPLTIALKGLQVLMEEVNRAFSDGSKKIVTTMDLISAQFNIVFGKMLLAMIDSVESFTKTLPSTFMGVINTISDTIVGWFESIIKNFAKTITSTADVIAKFNNYVLRSLGEKEERKTGNIPSIFSRPPKNIEESSAFDKARSFIEKRIKSSQNLLKANDLAEKQNLLGGKGDIGGFGGDDINGINVTSAAPKTFNINIDKLVEKFTVETTNIKEAPEKIREMVTMALQDALTQVKVQ